MTLSDVPCRNDVPWYLFTISLSGQTFVLRFRYNVRSERWIMDIADLSNNDIIVGIPVLIERDLVGRFAWANIPAGTFFAFDLQRQGNQPTRLSFGMTHALVYEDPAA